LATSANIAREVEHLTPPRLTTPLDEIRVKILINEQLAAAYAHAAENIQNEREELNVIDGACEAEMAEVTRAVVVRLTTAAARLSII
jgi:hypothetical protein